MKKLILSLFLVSLTSLSACKKLDLGRSLSESFDFNFWNNQVVIKTNATLIVDDIEKPLSLKSKAMTNKEGASAESISPGETFPIRVEYDFSEKDLTIVRIETSSPITLELPAFSFDLVEPLQEYTVNNLGLNLSSFFYGERTVHPQDQNILTTSYPLLFVPATQSGQDYDIQIALSEKIDYLHLSNRKKSQFQSSNPASVCDEENSEYYFLNDGFSVKIEQQVLINFYEPETSKPIATILPNDITSSIPSSLKKKTCDSATERSEINIAI